MLNKQKSFFEFVDILGQENLHLAIMPLSEWLKLDTERLKFVVRAIDVSSYAYSFRIYCYRREYFDHIPTVVFHITRYNEDGAILLSLDSTDYTSSTNIGSLDTPNARKFFNESFESLCSEMCLTANTLLDTHR